jgi:hypothetical protein
MAQLDAFGIAVTIVLGQLTLMVVENPVVSEFKRAASLDIDFTCGTRDLIRRDFDADLAQVDAVIAKRELDQSVVALSAHGCNDRRHGVVDVVGALALCRQQVAES